jgi:hypothetical protein
MVEESCCPDSLDVALKGQVVSGRGLAAPELLTLREQVQTIVQEPLCPGSLNIILNRPVRFLDTAGFAFDRDYRTLWPASLGGINVWVYRWRESPLHTVEILASVYLRERRYAADEQRTDRKDPFSGAAHLGSVVDWEAPLVLFV